MVITDQGACVAFAPCIQGYPTVIYETDTGARHGLYNPADMAAVEQWRSQIDAPSASPKTILTPYEFASRFSLVETAAMLTLTKVDPMAEAIQKRFDVAQQIDLVSSDVAQGLAYFVGKGVLTPERVQQIITPE